jgi:hypothetical protein
MCFLGAADMIQRMAVTLAERQLEMLRRMAALEPLPVFMGGYAEDALTTGTVTREHEDFDWVFPRRELALRRAQAEELEFEGFETWGEAAPGEPFYLFSWAPGDLRLDLGVADEEDGGLWVKVHKLFFEVDGAEAPAGFRVRLPDDTFEHPATELEGIPIRTVSPLALYQLRVGIASQGAFGELTEKQLAATRRLRETFFPGRSEAELAPVVEPLANR